MAETKKPAEKQGKPAAVKPKAASPVKASEKQAKPAEKPAAVKAPEKQAKPAAEKQAKPAKPGKKIKVTLIKSTIGELEGHKATVAALGLKKIRQFKVHPDNAAMRGMCFKVKHLIKVEEVS